MSYLEARVSVQSRVDDLQVAIQNDPQNPNRYNELAVFLEKLGEFDKAIHFYKEAIKRDAKFVKAYNNIGVILYRQGRYEQAVEMFKLSRDIDPLWGSTYVNLGAACNKAKRYEGGEKALLKAIELDDENSGAYANLVNIYNKMKRHDEARIQHEMALMLDDKSASNYANIGITYKNLGLFEEAKSALEKAIMIDKSFVNAHFDLATTYLMLEEYERGFDAYEWRFKKPEMLGRLKELEEILKKPRFNGNQEYHDKKLFLYTEQGYGDILQFARFIKEVKLAHPTLTIMIEVRATLKTLFSEIPYIDEVYVRGESVGAFDYQAAVMSLPHILGTKEISAPKLPYIGVDDTEIDLHVDIKKLNIGIVWGASNTGESYEDKVFSLSYFEPLMEDESIQLYSLQVAGDSAQIKTLGYEEKLVDLESQLFDFKQTALVIEKLDFVITSDTSVAHLAGAMGKEAWVVLQKNADWRWGREGDTSAWYKHLKLIRQEKQGDWQSAFDKVYKMVEERKY